MFFFFLRVFFSSVGACGGVVLATAVSQWPIGSVADATVRELRLF
jgi:hypothetical protein